MKKLKLVNKLLLVFAMAGTLAIGCPTFANAAISEEFVTMYVNEVYQPCENTCDCEIVPTGTRVVCAEDSAVDGKASIKAIAPGMDKVTVSCPTHGDKIVTVKVLNSFFALNKSSITLYLSDDVKLSQKFQLKITRNTAKEKYKWMSDDESVAYINQFNGVVTPEAEGTTKVYVLTDAGKRAAECTVTVVRDAIKLPVDDISLNSKGKGNSYKVIPEITGPNKKVAWTSSNPAVAIVKNGIITAKGVGSATITATANGVSDSMTVNVKDAVTSVSLDKKKITLYNIPNSKGDVICAYSNGKAVSGEWIITDPEIIEAVPGTNPKIVNTSILPLKAGTTTANFKYEYTNPESGDTVSLFDTCEVTVIDPSISLSKESVTLANKGTNTGVVLSTTVVGPGNKVVWTTSDARVATVKAGKVVAKGVGSATITATANGVSATCEVTVTDTSITGVPASLVINDIGYTALLDPVVTGTSKNVTYTSSLPSVASVDAAGNIVARNAGKTKITVSANGVSAVCTVTVNEIVTKLSKNVLSLNNVYKKETLRATIKGASKVATWSSSDESVVRVTNKGIVEAIGEGNAIIAIEANGKYDYCAVDVGRIDDPKAKVTITLDKKAAVLYAYGEGKTDKLTATVTNAEGRVSWISSNPSVATVDQDGNLVAYAPGTTTVTAAIGNKRAACTVKVFENALKLNAASVSLNTANVKKKSFQLKPTVTGKSNEVTYAVTISTVASVDSTGLITAIDTGTCRVIATANGISAYCDVVVTNPSHEHQYNHVTIRSASCTETGVTIHICNICDYRYSEITPKTSHSFGEWIEVRPATISTEGVAKHTCSACGYTEEKILDIIPHEHTYGEAEVIVAATCTKKGVSKKVCSQAECNHYEYLYETDARGHDWLEEEYESSNGIEQGCKYEECDRCSERKNIEYLIYIDNTDNPEGTKYSATVDGCVNEYVYVKSGDTLTIDLELQTGYKIIGWEVDGVLRKDSLLQTTYTLKEENEEGITKAHTVKPRVEENKVKASAENVVASYEEGVSYGIKVIAPLGATILYSADGEGFEPDEIKYSDVGSYTVYYKVWLDGYMETNGSATITINKASNTYNEKPAAINNLVYTGSEQNLITPGMIKYGHIEYSLDNDTWSTEVPKAVDAGTYTVYYKGIGNANAGDIIKSAITAKISPKTILAKSITPGVIDDVVYTGSAFTPKPSIKVDGISLTEGTDFEYGYLNNTNAGKATVTITGKGNFAGTSVVAATFNIGKASNEYTSEPSLIENLTYTGAEQAIINPGGIKFGHIEFSTNNGRTWSRECPKATKCGTYIVKYRGMGEGNATDIDIATLSVTMAPKTIVKEGLVMDTIPDVEYTGVAFTPKPGIVFDGVTLIAGTDFTFYYEYNVNVGTGLVYVSGKGNYSGTNVLAGTFNITKTANAYTKLPVAVTGLKYTGTEYNLINPGTIKKGHIEYSLDGENWSSDVPKVANAGNYIVKYKGIGDANTKDIEVAQIPVTIEPKSILQSKFTLAHWPEMEYTGGALEPKYDVIYDGVKLIEGTDFEFSYQNNTEEGTAIVYINGKGNYTGNEIKIADFYIQGSFIPTISIDEDGYIKVSATVSGEYAIDAVYYGNDSTRKNVVSEKTITTRTYGTGGGSERLSNCIRDDLTEEGYYSLLIYVKNNKTEAMTGSCDLSLSSEDRAPKATNISWNEENPVAVNWTLAEPYSYATDITLYVNGESKWNTTVYDDISSYDMSDVLIMDSIVKPTDNVIVGIRIRYGANKLRSDEIKTESIKNPAFGDDQTGILSESEDEVKDEKKSDEVTPAEDEKKSDEVMPAEDEKKSDEVTPAKDEKKSDEVANTETEVTPADAEKKTEEVTPAEVKPSEDTPAEAEKTAEE